jgi:hypothetical protein
MDTEEGMAVYDRVQWRALLGQTVQAESVRFLMMLLDL